MKEMDKETAERDEGRCLPVEPPAKIPFLFLQNNQQFSQSVHDWNVFSRGGHLQFERPSTAFILSCQSTTANPLPHSPASTLEKKDCEAPDSYQNTNVCASRHQIYIFL